MVVEAEERECRLRVLYLLFRKYLRRPGGEQEYVWNHMKLVQSSDDWLHLSWRISESQPPMRFWNALHFAVLSN